MSRQKCRKIEEHLGDLVCELKYQKSLRGTDQYDEFRIEELGKEIEECREGIQGVIDNVLENRED